MGINYKSCLQYHIGGRSPRRACQIGRTRLEAENVRLNSAAATARTPTATLRKHPILAMAEQTEAASEEQTHVQDNNEQQNSTQVTMSDTVMTDAASNSTPNAAAQPTASGSTPQPARSTPARATPTPGVPELEPFPSKAKPHGAPARQYLNEKVTGVLLEGMKRLALEKPEDPLRVLGEFLLAKSKEIEGQT